MQPATLVDRSRVRLRNRVLRRQRHASEDALRRVFNPAFYDRHAADWRDAMHATFAQIDAVEPADLADAWNMENRQRRGTFHSPAVDRYRFEVRTPFLDNDLVDHLLQAPPRWRFQQLAYKRMLVTSFPHAASVPWAYTGRPLRHSLAADLAQTARNYLDKRIRRWWRRPSPNGSALSGEFRDLPADVRTDTAVWKAIDEFTRSSFFPAEVFDRSGIDEIVRHHRQGRNNLTRLVIMIATFATTYRLFMIDRPRTIPAEADPTL